MNILLVWVCSPLVKRSIVPMDTEKNLNQLLLMCGGELNRQYSDFTQNWSVWLKKSRIKMICLSWKINSGKLVCFLLFSLCNWLTLIILREIESNLYGQIKMFKFKWSDLNTHIYSYVHERERWVTCTEGMVNLQNNTVEHHLSQWCHISSLTGGVQYFISMTKTSRKLCEVIFI